MKKYVSLFLLILMMLNLVACTSNSDNIKENQETSSTSEYENPEENIAQEDEKTNIELEKNELNSSNSKKTTKYQSVQKEEKKTTSTTVAISGAVIVEDDHESNVVYKRKCDSCGYTEPGTRVTTPGSMTSSFSCEKCGTLNQMVLKTTYSN